MSKAPIIVEELYDKDDRQSPRDWKAQPSVALMAIDNTHLSAICGARKAWTYDGVINRWHTAINFWHAQMHIATNTAVIHGGKLYALNQAGYVVRFSLDAQGIVRYPPFERSEVQHRKLKRGTARGIWYNGRYHVWSAMHSRYCTEVVDYVCDQDLQLSVFRTLPGVTESELSNSVICSNESAHTICLVNHLIGRVQIWPQHGYWYQVILQHDFPLYHWTAFLHLCYPHPRNSYGEYVTAVFTADRKHVIVVERQVSWLCMVRFAPGNDTRQSVWFLPRGHPYKGNKIRAICAQGRDEAVGHLLTAGWLRAQSIDWPTDLVRVLSGQLDLQRCELLHILFHCGAHVWLSVAQLRNELHAHSRELTFGVWDWCQPTT